MEHLNLKHEQRNESYYVQLSEFFIAFSPQLKHILHI